MIRRELRDGRGIAACLEGLAAVAGRQGQPDRAARLFGAAVAIREAIGAPRVARERIDYERHIAPIRARLGEEAFAEAWAAGHALTLEAALAEALAEPADE